MPALDVPPRHSTLGRVITGLMAFTVLWGLFVGVHPQPSPRVQMVMLLAMALLTVAALWLRRRDRCAYERRLAREAAARAVVEDRLVIARELHDAVSGNLGAITVRCAVAQRLETSPDGLRHALRDVESGARAATPGVRRVRAGRGGAGGGAPALRRPGRHPRAGCACSGCCATRGRPRTVSRTRRGQRARPGR